jgi:hypothetical protein
MSSSPLRLTAIPGECHRGDSSRNLYDVLPERSQLCANLLGGVDALDDTEPCGQSEQNRMFHDRLDVQLDLFVLGERTEDVVFGMAIPSPGHLFRIFLEWVWPSPLRRRPTTPFEPLVASSEQPSLISRSPLSASRSLTRHGWRSSTVERIQPRNPVAYWAAEIRTQRGGQRDFLPVLTEPCTRRQ